MKFKFVVQKQVHKTEQAFYSAYWRPKNHRQKKVVRGMLIFFVNTHKSKSHKLMKTFLITEQKKSMICLPTSHKTRFTHIYTKHSQCDINFRLFVPIELNTVCFFFVLLRKKLGLSAQIQWANNSHNINFLTCANVFTGYIKCVNNRVQ